MSKSSSVDRLKIQACTFVDYSEGLTFELERIEEGATGYEPVKREMDRRVREIELTIEEIKREYPYVAELDFPPLTHKSMYKIMMMILNEIQKKELGYGVK